jgi:hypothetical protein
VNRFWCVWMRALKNEDALSIFVIWSGSFAMGCLT